MNLSLESQGFLGTGATFLADLTLVAYVLLIMPAMIVGTIYARRGLHRPHHKWIMVAITVVNWVLILFLMLAAFLADVVPNLPEQPANLRYLLPAVHGLFGLPAQLLATYVVARMLVEDYQVGRARQRGETEVSKYWFKPAKITMQITLVLWLLTASLGIASYLVRYNVLTLSGAEIPAPATTPEVAITPELIAPPAGTEEALAPASTPDVDDDDDDGLRAASTPEVEPDDDDDNDIDDDDDDNDR